MIALAMISSTGILHANPLITTHQPSLYHTVKEQNQTRLMITMMTVTGLLAAAILNDIEPVNSPFTRVFTDKIRCIKTFSLRVFQLIFTWLYPERDKTSK